MVDLDSFLLALFTSLISFGLGIFSVYLRDILKARAEKKKLNKKFLDLFQAFTLIENPSRAKIKILILLNSMEKKILAQKLEMLVDFKYTPQKKTVKGNTKGDFKEFKFKEEGELHYEKEILRRFSLNTTNQQEFFYISECIEQVLIRLEDEKWLVIVGFFPFIIYDNRIKNSGKKLDFKNIKDSDKDTFIDFLKHLEEKYKKAKIIKKSKKLVDDTLITKIKGYSKK